MALTINPEYLFNFTEKEKDTFYKQQRQECASMAEYEMKLFQLLYSESKAIFANYGARPFSKLDVKYTINRLAKDDPTLTHLPFGYGDPVQGNLDAVRIAHAIKTNTHCQVYELADCGFTDAGAMLILNALRNKKVVIDLRGNRLTDTTFQYVAELMNQKSNQWTHFSFGPITPSEKIRPLLDAQKPRLNYQYKPESSLHRFAQRFFTHQR